MEHLDDYNDVVNIATQSLSGRSVDVDDVLDFEIKKSSRHMLLLLYTKKCTYLNDEVDHLSVLEKQIGATLVEMAHAKYKGLFNDNAAAAVQYAPHECADSLVGSSGRINFDHINFLAFNQFVNKNFRGGAKVPCHKAYLDLQARARDALAGLFGGTNELDTSDVVKFVCDSVDKCRRSLSLTKSTSITEAMWWTS